MSNKDKELAKVDDTTTLAKSLTEFDPGASDELFDSSKISISMLTHVSVPSGLVTSFTVDDELVKELIGIVVSADETRVMFPPGSTVGSGEKPLCSAVKEYGKELTGVGLPGGLCSACEFSKFGSKGKGCACDERRELFIITADNTIPLRLSVPPTSLYNWNLHTFKLRQKKLNLFAVWTSFTITTKKGGAGSYGVIVPTFKEQLSDEELVKYAPIILQLRDLHLPQPKVEDVFEE